MNGLVFDQYSKKLMWLIKEFTIGTPEEAWINQVKCGRVAMHKLRERYYGMSEGERIKTQAREALNKLHYRREHTFPFEKYITVLQNNFRMLEKFERIS